MASIYLQSTYTKRNIPFIRFEDFLEIFRHIHIVQRIDNNDGNAWEEV